MRAWRLSPAALPAFSRWKPIIAPSTAAISRRSAHSNCIGIPSPLTGLFSGCNQPVERVNVSLGAGNNNIGISTTPGVGHPCTFDTDEDLADGVNAFGHGLNAELGQGVWDVH